MSAAADCTEHFVRIRRALLVEQAKAYRVTGNKASGEISREITVGRGIFILLVFVCRARKIKKVHKWGGCSVTCTWYRVVLQFYS